MMAHPIHLAAAGTVGFVARHVLWLWINRRQVAATAAKDTAALARLTQHLSDVLNGPPDQDLLLLGMQIEQAVGGDHELARNLAPVARALAVAPSPAGWKPKRPIVAITGILEPVTQPSPAAAVPATPQPVTTYIADGVGPAVEVTPSVPATPEGT